MALYAIERVDDAVSLTREFLLPFDAGRWGRLAVMALFIGGGSGVGSSVGSSSAGTGGGQSLSVGAIPRWTLLVFAVLAVVAVVVGILVGVLSAIFELSFVESLRTERVALREYVGRFWRRGIGLFAFQIGLGIGGGALLLVLAAVVVVPAVVGVPTVAVLLALVSVPLLFAVAVALALALAFTTAFAVPVMLAEDVGVLAAWRRFWPTLRAEWRQFGAFAGVGVVLLIATGILASVVLAIPVVLAAIPFGLLFVAGLALFGTVAPLGLLVMAVVGLGFFLVVLAVSAFVQVPIQSFLRFYALSVLGDIEPDWDLIADRREPL